MNITMWGYKAACSASFVSGANPRSISDTTEYLACVELWVPEPLHQMLQEAKSKGRILQMVTRGYPAMEVVYDPRLGVDERERYGYEGRFTGSSVQSFSLMFGQTIFATWDGNPAHGKFKAIYGKS